VAAGAAAAKALGLSEEGVRRSISLATIQASGLFEVSDSGQMAKPINPGNAARTGIISALLARAGSDAPQLPLEGDKGFFKAFTDEVNLDLLLKDLGKEYRLMTCYLKLYPACRHAHAPVDVALKLRAKGIPPLDTIEKIKIYSYPAAIRVTGNIAEPVNEDEAKFSMTYATATAMRSGNYTLEDLGAAREMNEGTRALIRKMEIVSDPSLENRTANIRGSRIEIIMKDGTVHTESVILPKGDPEIPLDAQDMREKLRSCAKGLFDEKVQEGIFECAMRLDTLDDVGALLRPLA
jgi:2-methylcitrate dehydratase PrpD